MMNSSLILNLKSVLNNFSNSSYLLNNYVALNTSTILDKLTKKAKKRSTITRKDIKNYYDLKNKNYAPYNLFLKDNFASKISELKEELSNSKPTASSLIPSSSSSSRKKILLQ
jgi:hypothetical protein